MAMAKSPNDAAWAGQIQSLKDGLDAHFKEYNLHTDQNIFARMSELMHTDLPEMYHLDAFKGKLFSKSKAKKGEMSRYQAYAANVFKSSMLVDAAGAKGNSWISPARRHLMPIRGFNSRQA